MSARTAYRNDEDDGFVEHVGKTSSDEPVDPTAAEQAEREILSACLLHSDNIDIVLERLVDRF